MRMLADLVDLVLPASCVCCGRAGAVWCAGCQPASVAASVPAMGLAGCDPPTFAAGEYADELRTALLHFKERGRRQLLSQLADYLAEAVDLAIRLAEPGPRAVLVPVPSRRSAARARGGDHVRRLARTAGRHLGVPVISLLAVAGPVADSAGLNPAQRQANLAGRMRAIEPVEPRIALSSRVVLIDDIVTTGATLREAARALAAAGWRVDGAAVVARTRLRSATNGRAAAAVVGSFGRHQIEEAAPPLETV